MTRFFYVLGLLLASLLLNAQNAEFAKDVEKFLKANRSTASCEMAFDHIVMQFKMMKPVVPKDVWGQMRTEVFNRENTVLNKLLIPVYMKCYLPHEDIKELIQFMNLP